MILTCVHVSSLCLSVRFLLFLSFLSPQWVEHGSGIYVGAWLDYVCIHAHSVAKNSWQYPK